MITVRLATLEDTAAVTEIHRSEVAIWERIGPEGDLIPVRYDDLALYERWQHGGPWLSVETCAVHLNRLLAGAGFPLVAELDGQVAAEAEIYEGFEPPPFGHYLDISVLTAHTNQVRRGLGSALLRYIVEMARLMKCERVTVSHAEAPEFYLKHGFSHVSSGYGVRIPALPGRVVYQATELTDRSAEQIKGWYMPLGRYRSSRQEWERLFPQSWAGGIPELLNSALAHVKLSMAGQNAILYVREAEEIGSQPGDVHLACWSSRPLSTSNLLMTAIRDWAHRNGYPALVSYAMQADLALLGSDVQQTPFTQDYSELRL